jgi:hypothetical protein
MTAYQQQKLDQLRGELLSLRGITQPLQIFGEDNGYVFTRVNGVTVVIIKRSSPKPYGGYILPAVMTYKETGERPNTSLDAAVWAEDRFADQSRVAVRQKGHMGPVVNLNWRCNNDICPCQSDDTAALARRNGVALQ